MECSLFQLPILLPTAICAQVEHEPFNLMKACASSTNTCLCYIGKNFTKLCICGHNHTLLYMIFRMITFLLFLILPRITKGQTMLHIATKCHFRYGNTPPVTQPKTQHCSTDTGSLQQSLLLSCIPWPRLPAV